MDSPSDRARLEQSLLSNPFDSALRREYAELLLRCDEANDALCQFELLVAQLPELAIAHVGSARALHRLGRIEEAMAAYARARRLASFEPDQEFEELLPAQRAAQHSGFSVIQGGLPKSDNIVEFSSAARQRIGFDDIAGLDALKQTVRLQIIEPFLRPGLFAKFKKRAGGGVLLYGPPGCGKTMMARAVATECRAEFVSIGISDVLSMWIGESERNLAAIFDKARHSAPCVLFFDEIDALAFARAKAQSEHSRKIVNEFLSQLDGFAADNHGILILAATNMPWDVDSAMKRPGRFSRQVFVPPPDNTARAHIIEMALNGVPHDPIDPHAIAALTPHFSGADIEAIVEQAKDIVLESQLSTGVERNITQQDLLAALKQVKASTLDWLRTARNLVKYAGADDSYDEVGRYLKQHKLV